MSGRGGPSVDDEGSERWPGSRNDQRAGRWPQSRNGQRAERWPVAEMTREQRGGPEQKWPGSRGTVQGRAVLAAEEARAQAAQRSRTMREESSLLIAAARLS